MASGNIEKWSSCSETGRALSTASAKLLSLHSNSSLMSIKLSSCLDAGILTESSRKLVHLSDRVRPGPRV